MPEFAEVLLKIPVDRPFTYRIPAHLAGRVQPGCRVTVPFREGRKEGYVVRLSDRAEIPSVRNILEVRQEAAVDEKLLELTRWVAARYGCAWGEALEAAVPTGFKKARPGRAVRLVCAGEGIPRTGRQAAVLKEAMALQAPMPLRDFRRRTGASSSLISSMIEAGLLRARDVPSEVDAMADAIAEKPRIGTTTAPRYATA